MSAFRLRMERANRWGEGAVKHVENFRSAQSNRVSQFMWNAGSKVKAAARYSQGRLDDEGVPPGTDNFQMRTNNIRRMNSLGSGLQRFGGATGRGFTSLKNFADFGGNSKSKIGIPGLAIGAAGALGAANYMRQSFTQGGIKSNFSDISNLEGNTALYERAAAIKRRTFGPTGTPTFAQSMVLGAEDWRGTAGGGSAENLASKTDTLIAGAGNLLGQSLESNAGIILGAVDMIKGASFGGAQQFASNTMTSILRKIFN